MDYEHLINFTSINVDEIKKNAKLSWNSMASFICYLVLHVPFFLAPPLTRDRHLSIV